MTLTWQVLAQQAASLAARGVYIGTPSWKYPGWCGIPYDPACHDDRDAARDSDRLKPGAGIGNCPAQWTSREAFGQNGVQLEITFSSTLSTLQRLHEEIRLCS